MKVVSFDLDGTIFKKGLDDIFWNRLIPELVAREKGMNMDDAVGYVLKEYDSVGSGDIRWYIPEYWFDRFGIAHDLLDALLNVMEEEYYAHGMYDDAHLLADICKRYTLIISTCNPPAMARRKLSIIARNTGARIDGLFSSISYGMVKSSMFYSMVCRELNLRPESILHVGDDITQDLRIPRSVGMQAVLMDRGCEGEEGGGGAGHGSGMTLNGHDGLDHHADTANTSTYTYACVTVVCSMEELAGMLIGV
ncbi:MAG: HAD family hydrolase [Candidatus Nitrosocaldus sp.]|nr:HAD family hydrolase [Candidatus Nitrosocaldus sp.]MDW8275792.1 HAD family hydrolase [Candidatus Nitrosocaldus sp.]